MAWMESVFLVYGGFSMGCCGVLFFVFVFVFVGFAFVEA